MTRERQGSTEDGATSVQSQTNTAVLMLGIGGISKHREEESVYRQ